MLTSVAHEPFLLRRPPGSFCSSNRISPSCLGEPTLNGRPTSLCSSFPSSSIRFSKSEDSDLRCRASLLIPPPSIPSTPGIPCRPIAPHLPPPPPPPPLRLNCSHRLILP